VRAAGEARLALAAPCEREQGQARREPPSAAAAATAWFDLNVHVERLARLRAATAGAPPWPRREAHWQGVQRQLEQEIRQATARLAEAWCGDGGPAGLLAQQLGVAARTLRHWRAQRSRAAGSPAVCLGRPFSQSSVREASRVIGFLHQHGPRVGMPSLRAAFEAAPRVVLQDLLDGYRHLWLANHPQERIELHWRRAGVVWGMDFTQVSHPIDERYPYAFTVRDLVSGMQLLWRAVADETAATAARELELLFMVYGAPLVLKSDNGSAFRAGLVKGLVRRWGVWSLYSPPGKPWYNGAVEASIGSLKMRTQLEAWRRGHEDVWTSADLEGARQQANGMRRLRRGTPQEEWEGRRPPNQAERAYLDAEVRRQEAEVRQQGGIALATELDHYDQAALHRRVLESVLVQHGYLLMTRRRIPQRIFGRKVANFR
jgi:transposase InsO family protein